MFLSFLSNYMNYIIHGVGVIVTVVLIINYFGICASRSQIKEATQRTVTNTYINKATMETKDRVESVAVTPDTIRGYEKKFNRVCSVYNAISQIIPIFPLFGILGTVAGLILSLNESIGDMQESLDVALYSTFYGLIWTIFLKAFVALANSKAIQDTEDILYDYDKKFSNSVVQKNIE